MNSPFNLVVVAVVEYQGGYLVVVAVVEYQGGYRVDEGVGRLYGGIIILCPIFTCDSIQVRGNILGTQ